MKVVLIQTVSKVGTKGEVLDVKDGYGRNFLLPRGLAISADDPRAQKIAEDAKLIQEKNVEEGRKLEAVARKYEDKELIIKTKVGDKNQLFAAIGESAIKKEVKEQWDIVIEGYIGANIKSLGDYSVKLKFGHGIEVPIRLKVESSK